MPAFQDVRNFARRTRRRLTGSHHPAGGVVLAYHRVAQRPHAPPSLAVEPHHLAEQLAFIREHGTPISLRDMIECAGKDCLPPRAVAVTFDDGYRDVLRVAAPILQRAGIPATVFITTGGVDRDAFWWDRNTPGASPLSADEVVELSRADGLTIGSHTHSHVALARLDIDAQTHEIREARRRLEALTGSAVTEFAYPFGGRHDFSRASIRAARNAGVTIACSTMGGTVHRGVDPMRVPRIVMHNWTAAELAVQWQAWT